jgi:hypothetical protein
VACRCQPAPTGAGKEVAPLVVADIAARVAQGQKTYGRPLLTHDGRDSLWDAYEEALDLAIYLRKTILERGSTNGT